MRTYTGLILMNLEKLLFSPFYRRGKLRNLFELIQLANMTWIQYGACTASLKHNMGTCSLRCSLLALRLA